MTESGKSPYINYKLLGQHIREYRKARGMTQADMAEALGYQDESNYGKLERGDRGISLKKLAEVCIILSVPLETMLEGCLVHEAIIAAQTEGSSACMKFETLLKGQSQTTIDVAYARSKALCRK